MALLLPVPHPISAACLLLDSEPSLPRGQFAEPILGEGRARGHLLYSEKTQWQAWHTGSLPGLLHGSDHIPLVTKPDGEEDLFK